jgi:hypothetical protein
METRDLDRIRFVTQHFNDLQGLRYWVPLGLITLGWGGPMLLRIALILGAILLMLGAKRYYRDTFGEVERQPVDPIPVQIFGPPISRLEGAQQVTPIVRHFLVTVALALTLFSFFQAVPPNFLVEGDETLDQHPRIFLESAPSIGPPLIKVLEGAPVRAPSMLKAVVAQTVYVLSGSLFLGVWLWRERRGSHHLVLAVVLLGLSALGTSLGFLAGRTGEIAPNVDFLLPALVYPGIALLTCGSAMILAGFVDHWQLVRALGPRVEG